MVQLRHFLQLLFSVCICFYLKAQTTDRFILIKADRVFDGEQMHSGWGIWVKDKTIVEVGPLESLSTHQPHKIIDLKGKTLLPGLIEGHSHLLLHPYNETNWQNGSLIKS